MNKIKKEWKALRNNPALYFDQSFSSGTGKQIGWLLFAFICVLILLFVIYSILPGEGSLSEKFSNLLLLLIDPGDSDVMPFLFTVIVDVLGLILFGDMLISVASNILERRVEAYKNGETTYNMYGHVIIIGYNNSVPSLVKTLLTKHILAHEEEQFVVIQSEQPTEEIRSCLHIASDEWTERNTLVVHGQGNSREDLAKLHIDTCKEVWIIGDDTLEAHDSVNMETLALVAELWQKKEKLDCHMLFEHQTIYSVFQFSELHEGINKRLKFHPFNLHENWAKKVLVEGKAGEGTDEIKYKPLEGEKGIGKDSDKHIHLIIVGMSRIGTAMAVETAQTAHYFNFREDDDTTRTHITFIDCNAEEEMEMFMSRLPNVFDTMRWRYINAAEEKGALYTLKSDTWKNPIEEADSPYRHLGPNFTDLQWEFIDGRVESSAVRRYLTEAVNDKTAITTIAVCLPDAQLATQTTLYLPNSVLSGAYQVLVYQEESDSIIRSMNKPKNGCKKFVNIRPFGMINDSYSNNQIGDYEGMWVNAYYDYLYCDDKEKRDIEEKAWKNKEENWAKEKWEDKSVSDKWSSIHSANMIHAKLRAVGYDIYSNIDDIRAAFTTYMHNLVLTEHNRWVAEQLLAGFRPFYKDEWVEYHALPNKPKNIDKPNMTKYKEDNRKKKEEKAHANICSNVTLQEEEPSSPQKDEQVTLALIEIIEHKRKFQD